MLSSACFLVPDWWVELLFNYLQSVFCAWHSSSHFLVFTIKWGKGIYLQQPNLGQPISVSTFVIKRIQNISFSVAFVSGKEIVSFS